MSKNIQIIAIILSICISCSSEPEINIKASIAKYNLATEIYAKIRKEHFFQDQTIENINHELVEVLINQLDSQKIYFTQSEVEKLKEQSYSPSSKVKINTSYQLINLYFNRLIQATNYQIKVIKKQNFNFYLNEEILIDNEMKEWQENTLNLQRQWYKLAKNDVLTSMLAEKDKDKAIETILKRYKNRLRRISQRNEDDIFSIVMNSLAGLFDPHSSYFSPKSAEDFAMTMSLKLEGIGALMTTEDDYPVIVRVIPGGPAEKSGKISPDDKIVKISQLNTLDASPIDVVGWRIDEVVQLIRGEAGSKVELEIIPAKTEDFSERKWVTLTREEVKLEEQAAKSLVIDVPYNEANLKIGIINLPTFYIDFNAWQSRDPNFRSSSKDVQDILDDFNAKGVEGIIVDLRGNSGGSLFEANKLTGLFVSSGPTLQVKERNGQIRPWGDDRAKQIWDKPMAVVVNRYSASASEIFAGAIQDYQRGIILGHRTFGKGTVQQLDSLTSGQLKVTESKFYRVTGSGMQNKGVEPDIVLPSSSDLEEIGESSLDNALPWDRIRPSSFKKFTLNTSTIAKLHASHKKRVAVSPDLQYILDIRKRYDANKEKTGLSINFDTRKAEKIERQIWVLETENKRRSAKGLAIHDSFDDFEEFNKSKEEDVDKNIDVKNDYLLNESTLILSEYILLKQNLLLAEAA